MAPLSLHIIFSTTIFLLLLTISPSKATLEAHYYDQTCPQAEDIIYQVVRNASSYDPKVPARLLRMFFHDCFIRVLLSHPLSLSTYIVSCLHIMQVNYHYTLFC